MSENLSTEVTNNVEGFNLADWLVGGTAHRARKKVTLYLDASLGAEIDAVEEEITLAQQGGSDMDALGENSTAVLERRKEELLERLQAAQAVVEVFALIDSELAGINKELGKDYPDEKRFYHMLVKAGTLNGQVLTAEQWEKLHETVGSQFNKVPVAYQLADKQAVDSRFRR